MRKCPACGSQNLVYLGIEDIGHAVCDVYDCDDCGYEHYRRCLSEFAVWVISNETDDSNDISKG